MATLERGLGRGLDSLLRSTRSDTETAVRDIHKLALTQLVPGTHQPRRQFNEGALNELAASIRNQGVVQPLIVRPKADTTPQLYEIVAGERRWRAAKLAGLTEVPVVITAYTDDEAMTIALVENLQREDLNPVEEALALQTLRETYHLSQEDLAAKLGKSRPAIANSLRLLQLPKTMLAAVGENKISSGHGRALLAVTDDEAQMLLYQAVLEKGLSVREVEAAADTWKRTGSLALSLTSHSPVTSEAVRTPKPLELKNLQKMLRNAGHHGALVGGDLERGRISLPYTSRGELDSILNILGVQSEAPGLPNVSGLPDVSDMPETEAGSGMSPEARNLAVTAPHENDASAVTPQYDSGLEDEDLPGTGLVDGNMAAEEAGAETSCAGVPAAADTTGSGPAAIAEEQEADGGLGTHAAAMALDEAIDLATARSMMPRSPKV